MIKKNSIRKSLNYRRQKKYILKQNNFGYMMNIDEKFVETKESQSDENL